MKRTSLVEPEQPVAVIDIGSNSVRLVVFESASRSLLTTFNEKVLCGLGRSVATTGMLDPDGVARALSALGRFRLILDQMSIPAIIAFATAAVRDAQNGDDFLRQAESVCGARISILSGAEEAKYAVSGVVYGCPGATGLVGDLGGGSLELSLVKNGKLKVGETFPLGGLALMDVSGGSIDKARDIVDKTLDKVSWLKDVPCNRLYSVGGAWRTLARIHMNVEDYAMRILQNYTISDAEILDVVHLITHSSRKNLSQMKEVPARRIDSLPFSALVMERLLMKAGIKQIVISAYGVREGIVFHALTREERAKDPVIEGLWDIKCRFGRSIAVDSEMHSWMTEFLQGIGFEEPQREVFLRQQASLLHDIAWAEHPDHRANLAFGRVMFSNIAGLDHFDRQYLASMLFYRYTSSGLLPDLEGRTVQISDEHLVKAQMIGALMRLALTLSGGVGQFLPKTSLELDGATLFLSLPRSLKDLNGEAVEKRLRGVANALLAQDDIIVEGVEIRLR